MELRACAADIGPNQHRGGGDFKHNVNNVLKLCGHEHDYVYILNAGKRRVRRRVRLSASQGASAGVAGSHSGGSLRTLRN